MAHIHRNNGSDEAKSLLGKPMSPMVMLPGQGADEVRFYSVETLTRNFYGLAMAISLSNACATSCLDYAAALLGNRLGGWSSGALFAGYAVASFFLSKVIVTMVGPKQGLIVGVVGYSIYVIGFLISALLVNILPHFASLIVLLTSIIGGIGGGVLWTSQGLYFTRHTALYAQSTAQEIDKITADFSAIFAVILLGVEMVMKVLGSVFFGLLGRYGILALSISFIFGVLCSVYIITRIKSLDQKGSWDMTYSSVSKDVGAVARLVWTDKRVGLLLPFQMAFGLASSFIPYYIFGTVVSGSPSMGISAVGVLSAMVVFVGAVSAIPIAYCANKLGKPAVITTGAACLLFTGFPVWIFSTSNLGTWIMIVPLLCVYGVGRGVWETINKAVFVDFFADDYDKNASAFSAATFANGYAAGVAYASYSYMTASQMTSLLIVTSGLALACYLRAFDAQDRRKEMLAANAEAEARLDAIRQEGRKSRRQKRQDQSPERISPGSSNFRDGRISPGVNFSMGHGGISLITGRGNSHEDLMHAFKSVATHKIGGGIGGAIGNFSRGIGVKPTKKNKEKLTPERSPSSENAAGGSGVISAGTISGEHSSIPGDEVDLEGTIDEEVGLSMDSGDINLKEDDLGSGAL